MLQEKLKEKELAEQKYQEYRKLVRSKALVPMEANDSKVHQTPPVSASGGNTSNSILNTGKRRTTRILIGTDDKKAKVVDDVVILGDKNIDHFLTKIIFYIK